MLTDYHVHIERGPYTWEWLDRFIETAIANGVTEIGVVEHTHRLREFQIIYQGVVQDESAMGKYQHQWLQSRSGQVTLPEYMGFMQEAKRRGYPVTVGLEVCYFPEFAQETHELLNSLDVDFIIGSIHWLHGWGFDHPAIQDEWKSKERDQVNHAFRTHLLGAISSGIFDIIAHIDNIKAFSPWGMDGWLDDRVLQELQRSKVCLEVNTGLQYRRACSAFSPGEAFLRQAFLAGIPITLASDAHDPGDVGRLFPEALSLIAKVGYRESMRFDARKPVATDILR